MSTALARATWIAKRQTELLDCPYCHVVFTAPEPVAQIALQNKAVVYGILFRAAAETLLTIAADPRHLGAAIGILAVLHTWGQTLVHHPHLHCVVPGGGLSPDGTQWIACRPGFFLPVRVLSRLFRRLFLHQLQEAFDAQRLRVTGSLAALTDAHAFAAHLAPARAARGIRLVLGGHEIADEGHIMIHTSPRAATDGVKRRGPRMRDAAGASRGASPARSRSEC